MFPGTSVTGPPTVQKTNQVDNTETVFFASGNLFANFVTDSNQDSSKDKGFTIYFITGTGTGIKIIETKVKHYNTH